MIRSRLRSLLKSMRPRREALGIMADANDDLAGRWQSISESAQEGRLLMFRRLFRTLAACLKDHGKSSSAHGSCRTTKAAANWRTLSTT